MTRKAISSNNNKRVRILIADDSEAIRVSLSSLISRLPNVEIVGIAQTGTEAMEMIHRLKPEVVTLDIRMPEMNGLHVLEAIKREKVDTMVIVLTGLAEMEYRKKCLELGASHFFHKATEFEKVIDILRQHVSLAEMR